jgi:hypothetical protein
MEKRFIYELIVGIFTLIAITLFGFIGMMAMALLAGHSFVGKNNNEADEREIQLLYKVGNYTAGATLLASIIIFYSSDLAVNGHLIGKFWVGFVLCAFIIAHGASGLIIFKKN